MLDMQVGCHTIRVVRNSCLLLKTEELLSLQYVFKIIQNMKMRRKFGANPKNGHWFLFLGQYGGAFAPQQIGREATIKGHMQHIPHH